MRRKAIAIHPSVQISPFARKILQETADSLPEELCSRLTLLASSTGAEPEKNFIQDFALDGSPCPIYGIVFVDQKAFTGLDTRFCIEGYDVDHPVQMEAYSKALKDYKKGNPALRCTENLECGTAFRTFTDAYRFHEFARPYLDVPDS